MPKITFIIKCLIGGLTLTTHVAFSQAISFADAWQTVLTKNDALAAEAQNIARSHHLQDAVSDLNLPKISLHASYTRLDDDVQVKPSDLVDSMPISDLNTILDIDTTNIDSLLTSTLSERDIFSSSISALWPIYTGGKISAAQSIAKARHDEAMVLMSMKQVEKFEQLVKYYFGVVLSDQVLKTRQKVVSGLKLHYQHAQKLEAQGQINKLELLRAQVSLDKSKVDMKKSMREADITKIALMRMLKMSGDIKVDSPLFTNEALPEISYFIDKTLADFPALKQLNLKMEEANSLINIEKSSYYPKVYLYGNYNLYEADSLAAEIAPDWEVGIGLSIPLLDTSGRSGKTKAAHSTVLQVKHLKAQATQDLSVLVEKTYHEANQALEEYNGLKSSLNLSKQNLALQRKAFTQGLSTSVDVIDAELFVASIESQRLAASYQYILSLAKLLSLSMDINTFKHYQDYQGIEVK